MRLPWISPHRAGRRRRLGAFLLLGIELLLEHEEGPHQLKASTTSFGASNTIIVADMVMSLDNVMAAAGMGAAKGDTGLVASGDLVSLTLIETRA